MCGAIEHQLWHGFAGRRCIENTPDTVAGGNAGAITRIMAEVNRPG
jgi:hypothetical protein